MQCDYFNAAQCRSCTLMGQPYAQQLAAKFDSVRATLADSVLADIWLDPVPSAESGFRNKAKLVVAGTKGNVTLGILDGNGQGVDLRHCGLHEPALAQSLPHLAEVINKLGLMPYDVANRQGELKHVLVTISPTGELMIRFVLRSPGQLGRLRRGLTDLLTVLPSARVVSVNIQPEHKAVLEGPEETVLTEATSLPMHVNEQQLHLRPQSFFQTNTAIAAALYRQAQEWADETSAEHVGDLYCGVGGFALHLARAGAPARKVWGVETSQEAVDAARTSAREANLPATFIADDATAYAREALATTQAHKTLEDSSAEFNVRPDLMVVNPPRRGIGPDLASLLEQRGPQHVIYSSCQARTLAEDLARMPTYRPVRARLFDMFPQTVHHEVMVLLRRR